MHSATKERLAAPPRSALVHETRAVIDAVRMTGALAHASLKRAPVRPDQLVIVVPGFGSGDGYTAPLRFFLRRSGYAVEGWGLGVNLAGLDLPHTQDDLSQRWAFERRDDYRGEAGVPYLSDRLLDRVLQRHRDTGRSIALVGWSLGGYLAREVARDLPDVVTEVVTMGSPVVGGAKYTAAAPMFARRGMDLDWIEEEIAKREARPIQQPVTAIVSKSDAIVSWPAAIDRYNDSVRHIEVDAAHIGMGFNPRIWKLVLAALKADG